MSESKEFNKNDYKKIKELIEKLGIDNNIFDNSKEVLKAYEEYSLSNPNYTEYISKNELNNEDSENEEKGSKSR